MKPKVVVILGPTASGKSALAVRFAKKFNGEIVSADSRQLYKGLDIGTGKITKREMCGIPHHVLDVASPKRQFSVAEYIKLANKMIHTIYRMNKIPIIVGGTGFYIDTLLGSTPLPSVPPNPTLRKRLGKKTAAELFAMFQKYDPRHAKNIDRKNPRRLVRAIEIATVLGKVPRKKNVPRYDVLMLGTTLPDAKLRVRIHIRLLSRMQQGMVAEARRLHAAGLSWKRMDELGLEYRFLAQYLQKKISRKELLQKLESAIWQYARRQKTWFRRNKKIRWFTPTHLKKTETTVRLFLKT